MMRSFSLGTLVVLLASCGGHSSGRSVASGGIGGTGMMRGTITRFGSIFVNGVEWKLSDAKISTDGDAATEDDLGLGMVVTVAGTHDGTDGSAHSVKFDDEIQGPVESVGAPTGDPRVREVIVLGTIVRLEEGMTEFFDEDDAGFGFDTVAVGDVLEISGFVASDGSIFATRVEKEGVIDIGTTKVEIKGVIEGFDGANTFDLGSVSVTFDPTGGGTDLTDLPMGVEDGIFVEVKGVLTATAPNEIFATQIEPEDDNDFDDGEEVSIEGLITGFVDLDSEFLVAGVPVDASGATLVPNDESAFGNDVRVQAEGRIQDGILIARSLELRGGDARIHAEVANPGDVMAADGRIILLGITIVVDSSTRLRDDFSESGHLELADIEAGDFLRVRGVEKDGQLLATRIRRRETDDVKLRGRLQAIDPVNETVTIFGMTVPTDGATEFEDLNDENLASFAAFFAAVELDDIVEVEDDEDGDATSIDVATEVEIED